MLLTDSLFGDLEGVSFALGVFTVIVDLSKRRKLRAFLLKSLVTC